MGMATNWSGRSDCQAQASGMISVQADCSVDEAIRLMQERADVYPSETIESVAVAVVDRRIRFGD